MDMQQDGGRKDRGQMLAKDARIKNVLGSMWVVPSQSSGDGYVVDAAKRTCSCPDYELHRGKCKHQWAVEFRSTVVVEPNGDTTVTESVTVSRRRTFKRDWAAYSAAQCDEKDAVQDLLRSLCDGVPTPPHPGRGPKPIPMSDVVFGMVMKVYTTMSGRRATTDIRACTEAGHMTRTPHYNSLFNYFDKPELTVILTGLIEEAAAPLKPLETQFAVDSTGFSTSVYHRWYDAKYGREMKKATWLKAHAMVGNKTNVITAVRVTESDGADCPELPDLVRSTAKRFDVRDVSADKAYLSAANLDAIETVGAKPFIPMKINSGMDGTDAWRRLVGLFMFRHNEFMRHYGQRSNVESTFSSVKRKFGGSVRSKSLTAQINEVLCKVLCHNLTCLVQAMRGTGTDVAFWQTVEEA